jgi:acetylornithine deacetylase/succinyl-diaminopimelate desuccinylase-like protein
MRSGAARKFEHPDALGFSRFQSWDMTMTEMNRTKPRAIYFFSATRRPVKNICLSVIACVLAAFIPPLWADSDGDKSLSTNEQRAEDIFRQLVNFESTSEKPEQTRLAAEAMAQRLIASGMPQEDVLVINPMPNKYGMVARMRGVGKKKPLLTMAHIDVVTADPSAWTFPPFTFAEKDGYYFGRGTQDNKSGATHLVANFVRLQQERYVPDRDLILMLTGDEEVEGAVAKWLATDGYELIDAEYAINTDAGGGQYSADFKPLAFQVQTSEKVYQTFKLTITNAGGHSSLPRPDNSIYQLAQALVNISKYAFPVHLSPDAQSMFERGSRLESGQVAADMLALSRNDQDSEAAARLSQDPYMNALMRTTCVATMIKGGEAENALPREVSATINCRMLPGTDPAEVEATLKGLVANESITFTSMYDAIPSPASVLPNDLLESIESLVEEFWPGVPVIPEMATGATDGLFLRSAGMPVFGVAGWFMRPGDIRAHGLDEKIGVAEFHQGTEYWYQMLKMLSQP